MVLIHTPRTITSIGRGLLKARKRGAAAGLVGIGDTPHIYQARMGLLDSDYLGHMNNAAYLTHAEFARWEMSAMNGMLGAMYRNDVHFMVTGTTIRYRKEIRPILCKFQIDTTVFGLDERNMWLSHKFRLPAKERGGKPSRVMAQIILQAVAVKGREVMRPETLFKEKIGVDPEVVDSLVLPHDGLSQTGADIMERYLALEESLKQAATEDDELVA
jgi:acyl-CoA thioesterase FadM